jgi:alcohol-forming fatty acyl-CoA reductase
MATVKFSEPLHDAVEINVLNTQKVVKITNQIKHLKSFIHVSTLYSNSNRNFIEEVIYDHDISYQQLIKIAEVSKMKSVKLDFLHDFPNTYTLSKHFAEKLVVDQAGHLPVGIFRPPIVAPTYRSKPGWTDNINAFTGIVVSIAKGYIHCFLGKGEDPSNVAPVDYCANAMISAAWDVSKTFIESEEKFSPPIYNFMMQANSLTQGEIFAKTYEGLITPFEDSVYYCSYTLTSSKLWFLLLTFLFSTVPAFFLDLLATLKGKKARNLKISQKIKGFFLITSRITLRRLEATSTNLHALVKKVETIENFDKNLTFDLRDIDWKVFFRNHQAGVKKYFFKESMDEERLKVLRKSYQR